MVWRYCANMRAVALARDAACSAVSLSGLCTRLFFFSVLHLRDTCSKHAQITVLISRAAAKSWLMLVAAVLCRVARGQGTNSATLQYEASLA